MTGNAWQVQCRDLTGKRREVTVSVDDGSIVVVVPPGETAVLSPMEVGRLRAALREAAVTSAESDS
ncbi:hypothetical protein [Allosaccharopolyspora coralli]|uniref:hypothetical protein n=1 Tax=Allosaccharopolyspora coralli TaxID=2665642 RepID=UPI001E2EE0A7|nr:hypothetical protein [Allosaccharopolyspora coralli]